MNLSRAFKIAVIGATVLGGAITVPWAFCNSAVESYTISQCGPRGYIDEVPAPFGLADVQAVFWQIGFGNRGVSTGLGNDGTGFASKAFNGNDSGSFPVDLLDAPAQFPATGFPPGSFCLGSNDWANSGVDGCCDNPRPSGNANFDVPPGYLNNYLGYGPYTYRADDDLLNPYFGTYQNFNGFPGYYSLASIMDYPTAVLLKVPGDAYFAVAAVSSADRGNTGDAQNGPCAAFGGTNPAPCDVRQGSYSFGQIANGAPNLVPSEAGLNNAIPWQPAPRPREVSGLDCAVVDCSGPTIPVRFQIDPITFVSDEKRIPSNNPTLATRNVAKPRDATRAGGVGVGDLKVRWSGLVRYTLESAPLSTSNLDPNGDVDYSTLVFTPSSFVNLLPPRDANGNPTGPVLVPSTGTVDIPVPTCWRARVDLGKPPEAVTVNQINSRVGKLGDVGYSVTSQSRTGITCFGNRDPLASENIINAGVEKGKGRHTVRWETTAELSVTGFDVFAVTGKGSKLVATLPCLECSTGAGAFYETEILQGDVRGGKLTGFEIRMKGGSNAVAEVPVR